MSVTRLPVTAELQGTLTEVLNPTTDVAVVWKLTFGPCLVLPLYRAFAVAETAAPTTANVSTRAARIAT
jgi:hypothetical protein